jgi:hypothetical protein
VPLLNWIYNSRLSKNPLSPPFEKGGNRKSPFVKGDLEGFSSAQHDIDETLKMSEALPKSSGLILTLVN